MPEVKERPILFSGPMVRAILSGQKTVTRRALNARALRDISYGVQLGECHELPADGALHPNSTGYYTSFCPFGFPGDRLWVRESFWHAGNYVQTYPEDDVGSWSGTRRVHYRADGAPPNEPNRDYPNGLRNGAYSAAEPAKIWRARPSIHMPRWASRILLEITDVRVERLQDISEEQAQAEGIDLDRLADGQAAYDMVADHNMTGRPTAVGAFSDLWASINGIENWDANSWVWVVEFKRVEP